MSNKTMSDEEMARLEAFLKEARELSFASNLANRSRVVKLRKVEELLTNMAMGFGPEGPPWKVDSEREQSSRLLKAIHDRAKRTGGSKLDLDMSVNNLKAIKDRLLANLTDLEREVLAQRFKIKEK